MSQKSLHILVVDDSAYSRRALKQMIEEIIPDASFTYASAGDEGLQAAFTANPDLIFLDLEMPRMDGFTFLRLLMAKRPTPVIVVSGQNDEDNVLKALELGALDFISKPTRGASTRIYEIRAELSAKLTLIDVAQLSLSRPDTTKFKPKDKPAKALPDVHTEPAQLICIGASTGGPGAIGRILELLRLEPWAAIVISQHMPQGFTRAFAERLNRLHAFPVLEAKHHDRINAGSVYVCPGGENTIISRARDLRFDVQPATPDDRFVPSIDKLFASAAATFGSQTLGVVLTGMGNDGTAGSAALRAVGATVIAENPRSAVVFGMPQSVIEAGHAQFIHPIDVMPGAIQQWQLGILGPNRVKPPEKP